MKAFKSYIQERKYSDREKEVKLSGGKSSVKINPDSESLKEADIKPPAEKLKTDRNMFSIPADERDAAKARLLAKAKARREITKEETEMLSFSDFMEARRMDKEGVDRGDAGRSGRAEKAKASLAAVKKRQAVLDKHEKKTGTKLDISKSVEGKAHKQNHPGSRQAPKERGAKETPQETQNRRVNRQVSRVVKHGHTSKEKAANKGMYSSRFD